MKKKPSPQNKNEKKSFFENICLQLASIQKIIFLAFVFCGLIIGAIFLLSNVTSMPFSLFSRDMAVICKIKPFIGLMSNFGIVLWAATFGICFFVVSCLNSKNIKYFYCYSALLTLILLFDDMILFHDYMLQKYFHIDQIYIYVFYVIAIIVMFGLFSKTIFSTNFFLFFISGIFLGSSMMTDQWASFSEVETIIEDSLKFVGIVFWFIFFLNAGMQHVAMENLGCNPK